MQVRVHAVLSDVSCSIHYGNVLDIGKVARDILLLEQRRSNPCTQNLQPQLLLPFRPRPVPSSSTLHPFSITRRGPLSFFEEPGQAEIKRPNEGSRQRVEAERVRRGSMHRDKEIRSVSGLAGVAKKWISTG